MSNAPATSKQSDPPKTPSNDPPAKTIQVKQIWFAKDMDVPGKAQTGTVLAKPRAEVYNEAGERIYNKNAWLVEYTPAHRHHKITFVPGDKNKAEESLFVQEARVNGWKPA